MNQEADVLLVVAGFTSTLARTLPQGSDVRVALSEYANDVAQWARSFGPALPILAMSHPDQDASSSQVSFRRDEEDAS